MTTSKRWTNLFTRLRIVRAALAFRAGPSAALFLLAVGAAVAAAVGPFYLATADSSVLTSALTQAPVYTTGMTLTALEGGPAVTAATLDKAAGKLPRSASGNPWYGATILTAQAGGEMGNPSGTVVYSASLTYRTGECANLHIVSGSCPVGEGEVLLSTRSASAIGARTGSQVSIDIPRESRAASLRVAGTYLPGNPNAPYWWGADAFNFGLGVVGSKQPPPLDWVFTTQATIHQVGQAQAQYEAQVPLQSDRIRPGDVVPMQLDLGRYAQLVDRKFQISALTGVLPVLAQVSGEEGGVSSVMAVVTLELVLLALIVLYTVAARTSEAREAELALAALRGLSVRSSFAWAMLEPTVLLCLAMPAGLLLAWGGVSLVAPHLLPAATPTGPTLAAIGAVLLTLVAATVTLAAASRRLLRPTLAGDLRIGLAGPRRGRATAAEAAAVALAIAAVVELAVVGVNGSGKTDAFAALAPALLAIAVGLVGRRLLPALGLIGVRMTAFSRRVGTFLALRQVSRRDAAWRQLVELTVAVSLLVFAVSAWFAASSDRSEQASFVTGSQVVLTVRHVAPVDLLNDVRAADPSGKEAMAVVEYGTTSEELLAVDTSRFARVASWTPGVSALDAKQVVDVLHPAESPPLFLFGHAARVVATTPTTPAFQPDLAIGIFDEATQSSTALDLGRIEAGTHSYTVPFGTLCGLGCRFTGFEPEWPPAVEDTGRTVDLSISISALQEESAGGRWRTVPAPLGSTSSWRGIGATEAGVGDGPDPQLRMRFVSNGNGTFPVVAPADAPAQLPAIVTPQFAANDSGSVPGTTIPLEGLDGNSLTAKWAGSASALPSIGDDAALVDLSYAAIAQTGTDVNTVDEVWVSTPDDGALLQRLHKAGLDVVATRGAGGLGKSESHGSDALADLFLLIAGGLAVLLAAGTSVVLLLTEGRERGVVVEALSATGVSRRALRRSLVTEQLIVLTAGTILGALTGVVAAKLALRTVPVVAQLAGGPPLTYPLPVLPILAAVGVVLIVLFLTMGLGVRAAMRSANTTALRVKAR